MQFGLLVQGSDYCRICHILDFSPRHYNKADLAVSALLYLHLLCICSFPQSPRIPVPKYLINSLGFTFYCILKLCLEMFS